MQIYSLLTAASFLAANGAFLSRNKQIQFHGARHRSNPKGKAARKKNVLFIVCDDLRPDLGAYNDSVAYTPNIDKLASEGLTFKAAFTNYGACAPSRSSFMTGRLPDVTRDFTFVNHFREHGVGEDWRSMPQFFKEIGGYYTAMSGKVFHAMLPPNNDYPLSWSAKPYSPDCRPPDCPDSIAEDLPVYPGKNDTVCQEGQLRHYYYCAAEVSVDESRLDKMLIDQRTRESCIRQLREGANQLSSGLAEGFFVACGFHKPHLSLLFPAAFLSHYPMETITAKLPLNNLFVPANMPQVAWAETSKGLGVNRDFNGTQDLSAVRSIRRAYYAAVSYIDDAIGRVLAVLEELGHADDTLVVLTSDHGVAMGEQGTWGKMTNFESTLKIPLIMRAPWIEASVGKTTGVLAELVDLYATLADLAGLPEPASVGESINGTSLAPVLANPEEVLIKTSALSQLAKPNLSQPNERTLTVQRNELEMMGYSLRKQLYRYTAWFKFNGNKSIARTRHLIGRELYTYDELGEGENLVDKPRYAEIVDSMHAELLEMISSEPMTANQTVMPILNE